MGQIITGATPSRSEASYWNGDIPWVTAQDFSGKYIFKTHETITEGGGLKCRIIPPNSVLVTCIASIGLNAITRITCATNQQINAVICGKEIMPEFLYYIITSKVNTLKEMAGQTAVPIVSKGSFSKLEIEFPPLNDQQTIAYTLSSIDTQISATQNLLSKYESIKKATVKKLMTPSIGWETIPLGELCDDYGYGVSASATEFDGINKYIRITDIDDSSHKYLPAPLASPSFFTEKHIVHKGDILFARTGASVGKSYLYNSNDGRLIYAGFLIRMHIDSSKANPAFIFQQTLTNSYWQWVATESARTGQPGLNIEQYKKLILQVPDIIIQNAIASKLSAYDIKISELNKELKKLIDVKQAMLQHFFGD